MPPSSLPPAVAIMLRIPLTSLSVVLVLAASTVADDSISFTRQIRGLLSDRCFQCHGPDENDRQAGLRLDDHESALAELDSGARAIVPGDAAASALIERLITDDPDLKMPPEDSGKTISAAEIELLKTWINQGAEWGSHWAFEPVQRPQVPTADPAVTHPIDQFVRARLAQEQLTPAPQADAAALLRRVSLDLTGLPPTQAELSDFLNNDSPDAYAQAVDRLLDSPRYGEHMSRYWLDVARYGDTHGLHLDNYREMWAYRDWVIDAFNNNKAWDSFTVEQLAGDLLPNATQDQLIASGFNRCNVTTGEGGSIVEEVHSRNVVDRVVTMGTAFMALTLDCSRCHDHKFDPLTMKDFYSFYAFFNSLDGNPMDGNKKDHAPAIKVLTSQQKTQMAGLESQREQIRQQMNEQLASVDYQEPKEAENRTLTEPVDFVWLEDQLPVGVKPSSSEWKFVQAPAPVYSGKSSAELTANGVQQNVFGSAPAPLVVAEGDSLFCHVYLDPDNSPRQVMLQFHTNNWEHRVWWGENLIPWGKDNTPSRFHAGELPAAGEWIRLEVKTSDVGLKPGDSINGWACTLHGGHVWWDQAGIRGLTNRSPWYQSFNTWLADVTTSKAVGLPVDLQPIALKEADQRSDEDTARLKQHFLRTAWTELKEPLAPQRRQLAELEHQITMLNQQAGTTLVYRELKEPKPAFVLDRGEYDRKGEQVGRAVPSVLSSLPEDVPLNRLGLARWLTSPQHPLMSRVTINRLWQQFFGTGLVKTSEDFGSQGEPPSHPQLLDWLSAEFMDPQLAGASHRWDVKHLVRQIVLSQTYRQSAVVRPEVLERDPANRLLARGPRFRLDAESLRDQALYVSGLLHEHVGGPSVKPPQPKGLWNIVGYTDSNTANFTADEGHEKVHRRTLYTFMKRTAPAPQMSTFDGPSRESCVVRRERSNSPMQALLLMNDPQYVECARSLAEQTLKQGEGDQHQQATWLLKQCLLRDPSAAEVDGLVTDYQAFAADYQQNPEAARQLIMIGERIPAENVDPIQLASWTMVSNLVLNLDEVINK